MGGQNAFTRTAFFCDVNESLFMEPTQHQRGEGEGGEGVGGSLGRGRRQGVGE